MIWIITGVMDGLMSLPAHVNFQWGTRAILFCAIPNPAGYTIWNKPVPTKRFQGLFTRKPLFSLDSTCALRHCLIWIYNKLCHHPNPSPFVGTRVTWTFRISVQKYFRRQMLFLWLRKHVIVIQHLSRGFLVRIHSTSKNTNRFKLSIGNWICMHRILNINENMIFHSHQMSTKILKTDCLHPLQLRRWSFRCWLQICI
jgi:hypothetical protein